VSVLPLWVLQLRHFGAVLGVLGMAEDPNFWQKFHRLAHNRDCFSRSSGLYLIVALRNFHFAIPFNSLPL